MYITMSKTHQTTGRPGSGSSITDHVHSRSLVVSDKHATHMQSSENEQPWIIDSHSPTDLTIQVQGVNFYVHKYKLIARSEYISRWINLHEPSNSNFSYDLKLENLPGGSETFKTILKFCYGIPVELTTTNVAPLRCASEFLQMIEECEEGNLISKTEAFLTFVVLTSWQNTITVLKSCESLSPWAENLQITRRCSDSIAWKVSRDDGASKGDGWWFNDVSTLCIDHFVRIITVIKAKGMKSETVGSCIMNYAEKRFPNRDVEFNGFGFGENELQLSIWSGRERFSGYIKEHRMIIEKLVSLLPPQREAVPCKFLLWMLKMAVIHSATPALISELERRVGMVLEDADVNDLLIPSYRHGADGEPGDYLSGDNTMHNIDMVQRIVEYFVMHDQQQQQQQPTHENLDVAKSLDGYLVEIASDPNLSISKFQVLAEALNENARVCHDGLYKAIDTYLKTHPDLTEHDKRRFCRIMDCERLSFDACMHAAQNERLPLRTVMQVLFLEQVKMRATITSEQFIPSESFPEQEKNLSSATNEIKTIKEEVDKLKTKMASLQHDCSNLQQEFEQLTTHKSVSGWTIGWKKFKSSTLFHSKVDETEKGDMLQRRNRVGSSDGRRRRLSIS